MTTDTTVSDLIVNKLTYSQWKAAKDGGTLSNTETYDLTDKDTAFVHSTGNETIVGEKTFTSMPTINHDAAGLRLENPNITKGTSPSSNKYGYVELLDKNGSGNANRIGLLEFAQKPNGDTVTLLAAYKDVASDTERAEIDLVQKRDGTAFASCPTPPASDDSNKIATTEWVNDNAVTLSNLSTVHVVVETYQNGSNWYRLYDDGWVEQGGEVSYSSTGESTVSLIVPYLGTYYAFKNYNSSSANTLADREGSCYNRTSTSFKTYNYIDDASLFQWFAVGYGDLTNV